VRIGTHGAARGLGEMKRLAMLDDGCCYLMDGRVDAARKLVYADGYDLDNLDAAVPIGTTCRLCDRLDCEQRAFPPLQHGFTIDENVRGASFYAPAVAAALPTGRKKRR
jgi:predicted transcriptional regulator